MDPLVWPGTKSNSISLLLLGAKWGNPNLSSLSARKELAACGYRASISRPKRASETMAGHTNRYYTQIANGYPIGFRDCAEDIAAFSPSSSVYGWMSRYSFIHCT